MRIDVAEKLVEAGLLKDTQHPDEFQCYQENIIESRHIGAERLRRWFYADDEDLLSIESEMRTMIQEDLVARLGAENAPLAPYRLRVSEREGSSAAPHPSGYAPMSDGPGNQHYIGFKDYTCMNHRFIILSMLYSIV